MLTKSKLVYTTDPFLQILFSIHGSATLNDLCLMYSTLDFNLRKSAQCTDIHGLNVHYMKQETEISLVSLCILWTYAIILVSLILPQ